jgi:hypothetical protein
MDTESRIKYFENLLATSEPISRMPIWYENERQELPVYKIDLGYLLYNQYNGRIASLVKSYEKQSGVHLDSSKKEDKVLIEKFLKNSNKSGNKKTKKSIKEQGQLKYGIVTKDGVIIDGNRRAMILNEIFDETNENPRYFRGVILDKSLEDNAKEIMRLETTYQMGEDAKVDYNAIEKYLKCQDLIKEGFSEEEIGKMMGESESKVKDFISIMNLMDDYLEQDQLGYDGIYTRLDKTEGAFVDLNSYLKRYQGCKSKMVLWNYEETDINDLREIYFDYIRGIYNSKKSSDSGDSKDYRYIGQASKKGSFFINEVIWNNFRDRHFDGIEEVNKKEPTIDEIREKHPNESLDTLLKSRDVAWARKSDSLLKSNLGRSRSDLDNKNNRDKPLELLISAKDKLDSINIESKSFLEDENVFKIVDEIRKLSDTYKNIIKKHQKNS